jgi:hypothetical protein
MLFAVYDLIQYLRLETGDSLLLETGDKILFETGPTSNAVAIVDDGSEVVQMLHASLLDKAFAINTAQYTALALFIPAHFGPDATGNWAEPSSFDIIEGRGEFELRRPL